MAPIGSGGTISAAGTYEVGQGIHPTSAATIALQLDSAAFVGSVTVKARVKGGGGTWTAIAYYNLVTGSSASAAITGAALIYIPASGLEVQLDCTAYTSGTLTARISALVGAAA